MELDKLYRPKTLDQVIGQDLIVDSIKNLFQKNSVPHVFLFTGGSGVGKTSIARIIAHDLDCAEVYEVDASTFTGVDDMRDTAENLKFTSFIGNGRKFLILDECHMLSKSAWNSWLKMIEEPPEHVYICFCTTELSKVPTTIQTRCHRYTLKEISTDLLSAFVEMVSENEKIELPKGTFDLLAKESYGSARQVLVFLSQIRNCKTVEEVAEIIGSAENNTQVVELCRLIINRGTLSKALSTLKKLKDTNPYSIKIQIMNYLVGCVLNSKNDKDIERFLALLEVFDRQVDNQTGFAILVLCISEIFLKIYEKR